MAQYAGWHKRILQKITKTDKFDLRMLSERETGLCGKSSHMADLLPPPPSLGMALWFIVHFRTFQENFQFSKIIIIFGTNLKKSNGNKGPPLVWVFFPDNPVFLFCFYGRSFRLLSPRKKIFVSVQIYHISPPPYCKTCFSTSE